MIQESKYKITEYMYLYCVIKKKISHVGSAVLQKLYAVGRVF